MTQNNISPVQAYLLGLLTGRGHIFSDNNTLAIEFSHANEFAYGVAHCPKCGDLATKQGDSLKCKKCGHKVDPNVKSKYDQPKMTVESLESTIIPYLQSEIQVQYGITGNKAMTLLVMEFQNDPEEFEKYKVFFKGANSFDAFHLPQEMYSAPEESQIEFVNGLLDTAGFASPGGWLNRDGENMHGRMRVYFQIVRNWYLPVEIDNFLRKVFNLPIHTIDWGHPNIRDASLEDFYNARPTSWSREHQIKFFPEYYSRFHFRISSKQALFDELNEHNQKAVFNNQDDWFPPKPFRKSQIKSYHPGESDVRIPEPVRKHVNAFWQINASLGCDYIAQLMKTVKNPEYFYLTGTDEDGNVEAVKKEQDLISQTMYQAIVNSHPQKTKPKSTTNIRAIRQDKEKELYAPLSAHLTKYLTEKYNEEVVTVDNSASNLNLYLKNQNIELFKAFDFCEKFRIRPDIVGFLVRSKKLIFEEAKITQLDIKALGQLLGYCFVAQPEEAILVSSEKPSMSLIKILKARPDLLEYSLGKKIQIATWEDNDLKFIEI